ncbi:Acetyltransferases [Alteromonadaceae bacterium Bs31]|nr:Acetyltransferases [Alteromonadaceae bacterium Bs31]
MPEIRPMYKGDIHHIIRIIDAYDDDDAEAAEEDYEASGLEDQFVLEVNDKVIGVTGFRRVEATDKTAWLSWTYVDKAHAGQGYGKAMLGQLLDKLKEEQAGKIFVKVSNYEDPEDGKIYERAHKMYQSLGFELELTNKDFYDEGEDQLIYGKVLTQSTEEELEVLEEKPVIRFNGMYEIAESEGAYTFSWIVEEKKAFFGKRSFSVDDLRIGLQAVKNDGGRKVFLTFPSNLPLIHQPLQAVGFKYIGNLTDYYEKGVHEMHFSHSLDTIE